MMPHILYTSAVIAIVANEPMAEACSNALKDRTSVIISAGTLTELLIVAAERKLLMETRDLIEASVTDIIDLTPERAQQAAAAYVLWGKTVHPAALNFGDCFAYATAREYACPLLYIGNDFTRTDVPSAIPAPSKPM